eukprot:UN3464
MRPSFSCPTVCRRVTDATWTTEHLRTCCFTSQSKCWSASRLCAPHPRMAAKRMTRRSLRASPRLIIRSRLTEMPREEDQRMHELKDGAFLTMQDIPLSLDLKAVLEELRCAGPRGVEAERQQDWRRGREGTCRGQEGEAELVGVPEVCGAFGVRALCLARACRCAQGQTQTCGTPAAVPTCLNVFV